MQVTYTEYAFRALCEIIERAARNAPYQRLGKIKGKTGYWALIPSYKDALLKMLFEEGTLETYTDASLETSWLLYSELSGSGFPCCLITPSN